MAEILRARDLQQPDGPPLAVKRILPHLTEDPQYVTMFLDESRVLANLEHANIIHTHEVGQVGPTPYIALEYVHGHDARMLLHRCRRDGLAIPVRIACFIMAEVCAGLHFAHEKTDDNGDLLGLVHRDVSLQNILVSYDGHVKLIDFGIAMSAANQARTEVGIVKGKFGYMSPEQVKGEPLDRRSDVFAAGICLYELLTTERLFSGENDYAAVERVRNVRIDPPSRKNRQVPSALEAIVMKALAKSPRDRFQSAGDLRRALLAFMNDSGNACSAVQLGEHMREVFADELSGDAEPAQTSSSIAPPAAAAVAPRVQVKDAKTGLAAFDDLDPVSTLTALEREPVVPAHSQAVLGARVSAVRAAPAVAPAAPAAPAARSVATTDPPEPFDVPTELTPHPFDAQSAPVDMDWDEEEPITQHANVEDLPDLPDPIDEDDRTRQIYVGDAFAQSAAQDAAIAQPLPAVPHAPAEELVDHGALGVPAASVGHALLTSSGQSAPESAVSPGPSPPSARASYALIVAVVATIVALISVGLMATRGARPASIHLSTLPTDAEVRLDGNRVAASRSPYVLDEIEPEVPVQIDVVRDGYQPWSTRITLQPGQVLALPRVALVPTAAPSVPAAAPAPAPAPEPAPTPEAAAPAAPEPSVGGTRAPHSTPAVAPPPRAPKPPRAPEATEAARSDDTPKQVQKPPVVGAAAAAAAQAEEEGGTGVLRLNSRPWSEVTVDGRSVGNTPLMNLSLPAGTHEVELANPQFGLNKKLRVRIRAGETVTKVVDLQE